ncbi:hypothetical protein Bbelb_276740 [Branchiostoma belcheri]|nr:hypothetical protein Bbelb_276740 [Branchiostoma belcheri]
MKRWYTSTYGSSGCEDSGGDCGGRGNSDNSRRDEGINADWKAITTVVVVAMVADDALIICDATEHCGNYGDSGGNISYGDGDGRDGSDDAENWAITAIVFTAIAVVAAVAITRIRRGRQSRLRGDDGSGFWKRWCQRLCNSDGSGCEASEVTAVVDGSYGSEDCATYGDRDRGGNSDNPGRNEDSDFAKEAITAVGCDGAEHCDNYGDSGGNISYGDGDGRVGMGDLGRNEGDNAYYKDAMVRKNRDSGCKAGEVTAVVGSSDGPGRDKGSDVALEAMTVNGAKDYSNYAKSGDEISHGDGGGRGGIENPGTDGAQNCGNYGNSGGKDSGGDRGGRGNGDNLRHDEGVDADWKAITTVVVVAMVTDATLIMSTRCDGTEHCGNYGDSGRNISYGDGDGRGGMEDLRRNESDNAYYKRQRQQRILRLPRRAVVAATAMIQDATRAGGGGYSSEDCGNYGGGECEGSYGECGCRGNGDNLGRDEDGDFALEAITRGSRDDGCDCGDEISYGDGDGRGGIDNPGHVKGGGAD